jgi:hypothetical protein
MIQHRPGLFLARRELVEIWEDFSKKGDLNYDSNSLSSPGIGAVVRSGPLEQSAG